MKYFAVLVLMLFLSSCGDSGFLNLAKMPVDGDQITQITGQVKDSSVQKEALYLQSRQHRDSLQRSMYKESGLQVKFVMKEVAPGVFVQMMETVTMRESPKFDQPLPTGPSVHPLWGTINNVVDKGISGLLWYTGIKEAGTFLGKQTDNTGTKYYGNYNPQTAEPYVVRPEIVVVQP